MAHPKFAPQKYPFPWNDRQTPPPASSLDPSDLRCQTAFGSDPPFFHNALAAGHIDRPTERSRESSMTIGRCATRAMRPNNNKTTIYKWFCNAVWVTTMVHILYGIQTSQPASPVWNLTTLTEEKWLGVLSTSFSLQCMLTLNSVN